MKKSFFAFAFLLQVLSSAAQHDSAALRSADALMIFPNPAAGILTLQFGAGEAREQQVIFYDATDKIVKRITARLLEGRDQVSIPTHDLYPGKYTVLLLRNGKPAGVRTLLILKN